MKKQYHILNGDSLMQQFPKTIDGEIIVARECFVDGSVEGEQLDELFASRARFLYQNYGEPQQAYYKNVVSEFQKIQNIGNNSDINLWFEDDLFCQVNFWFVTNLLENTIGANNTVYLIRPDSHNQYGFAGLNQSELVSIYKKRVLLPRLNNIASLWKSYQNNNTEELIALARQLKTSFPFILPAVQAHIARIPTKNSPGRPVLSLLEIMNDLDTKEFGPVFREFCKRENIYGFGDLQVKRLLDEINKPSN
ncbi:DUF1835 domain-containing protein [Maribellus comscasis]|uniref:DUF1835 domain-containing protein n=1 Tax=Maribellus comscasis TaxID=2681766 RepID=A0A6I6K3C6_9BACT|nr:DUF1835 domain-containing protein [Maribellus comscasis]QGY47057.1 DUF1835 domain-containing protein [Maribellus comscasis]